MKFIQVFNRYIRPGGEEFSVRRIAMHLEEGGHQVERFWRASEEWSGPGAPPAWQRPFLLFRNGPVLDELRRLQEKTAADAWILHNILPVVSLGIYQWAAELNVPVIQWLHNYRPISPGGGLEARGRSLDPADRWILIKETLAGTWRGRVSTALVSLGYWRARRRGDFDKVAAWVAVSEEMRRLFLKGGWQAERLFTLRHAWDVEPPRPPAASTGHFLFLGRLLDLKGVRFLVDLWQDPELREIPLIIAGEGPLQAELARRTPPAVQWPGFVSGVAKQDWVRGARAILFPCLWPEPLSTVVYEAYQQERPILASNLGGLSEIIFDHKTGRLLPPGDKAAWKNAILELWRNPDAASAWGKTGRTWLEDNISSAAWNRGFDDILCRIEEFARNREKTVSREAAKPRSRNDGNL